MKINWHIRQIAITAHTPKSSSDETNYPGWTTHDKIVFAIRDTLPRKLWAYADDLADAIIQELPELTPHQEKPPWTRADSKTN